MSLIYANSQLDGANPPSETYIESAGYQGFTIQNYSPWGFSVSFDSGNAPVVIPPWSVSNFPIPSGTQKLKIQGLVLEGQIVSQPIQGTTNLYVVGSGVFLPVQPTTQSLITIFSGTAQVSFAPGQIVSIGNTVTVQGTGTFDVSGNINVTNSGSNPVPVYINQTVNVSVTGTANVNITNSNLNVNVQNATISVEISSSGNNVNVGNTVVPSNELVFLVEDSVSISNLANGSSVFVNAGGDAVAGSNFHLGLYDGVVLIIQSSGGYMYSNGGWDIPAFGAGVPNLTSYGKIKASIISDTGLEYYGGAGVGVERIFFDSAYPMDNISFSLINNTGGTIASDTVHTWLYGIRAQVEINNPTSIPAQMQPAVGEFGTLTTGYYNTDNAGATGSAVLINSGGYIRSLQIQVQPSGLNSTYPSITVNLYNNTTASGNPIRQYAMSVNNMSQLPQGVIDELNFDPAIANNGWSISWTQDNGGNFATISIAADIVQSAAALVPTNP